MQLNQFRNAWLTLLASTALALTGCPGGGDAPTINSFTATPMTVAQGGMVTLAWSVSDADTITITNTTSGNVVSTGSAADGTAEAGPINADTSFMLVATNSEGDANRTVSVTVMAEGGPVIESFTANPMTVDPGQTVTLTWDTTNATAVDIDNGVLTDGMADGTVDVMPTVSTTYTLTARDGDGNSTTAQVRVMVNGADVPVINAFTASPNPINFGETTNLSWDVTGADSIRIEGPTSGVVFDGTGNGNQDVGPLMAQETFTLTAMNAAGQATDTVTVNVNPQNGAQIDTWDANPTTIMLGQSSDLTWAVQNAPGGIEISDGMTTIFTSMDQTGTFAVNPGITTVYTLTAINPEGNATADVTVTVDVVGPVIVNFDASPNPTSLGGTTTLSWQTMVADSISIRAGNTEIYNTTTDLDMGTFDVTQTVTSTTYTLVATNADGSNMGSVTVYAHNLPIIQTFDVAPQTFQGSATATITWDVLNVSSLALEANGMPVAGFPGVMTSTATVDDAGTFSLTVSQTTTFRLIATSAGGTAELSATISSVIAKMEPNNTSTEAISLAGDGSGVFGSINPGDDEDWYSVVVPAGGNIFAETSNGQGGCDMDTTLTITSTDGMTQLAFNDDGGAGLCSLINPLTNAAVTNLAGGTYFVVVESFGANTGDYTLVVNVQPPACGNSILEAGEQCDDGNTAGGDSCDANCMVAPVGVLMGPGVNNTFMESLSPAGNIDYFQIDMAADGYIGAETFSPTAGECNNDTIVRLWDANFNELGSDDNDGIGLCSLINPQLDAFASVTTGTYFLSVEDFGNNTEIPAYVLQVTTLGIGCGNGIQEAGETCDDGNTANGDGCSSACVFEGTPEIEPNNDAATAQTVPALGGIFSGGVDAQNNDGEDWYAITVAAGQHLNATLNVGGFNICPASPEGRLRLYDTDGTTVLVTDNNSGPNGNCGAIRANDDAAAFDMAAGTYYLVVDETGGNPLPNYFLDVQILDPGCGNGILEAAESCDDGNQTAGDGCSATCTIEPAAVYTAPGGPMTYMGAIPNVGDRYFIQIDVTAPAVVDIETFSDAAMMECTGFDTVIRLYQADGTTEIVNDDQGGIGNCSRIEPIADPEALLAPGTYLLAVEDWLNNDAIPAFEVVIRSGTPDVCGNGIVETNEACDDGNTTPGDGCDALCAIEPICGNGTVEAGEQCDDGNTTAGDGCDAACGIEAAQIYTAPGGPMTYSGSIPNPGDAYYVQINVTAPAALIAETFTDSVLMECNGIDTVLRLYENDGTTQLGTDDEGGINSCSRIDPAVDGFAVLGVGTYFLRVEDFLNNTAIPAFELVVDSIPALVCGNGIVEPNEACDDGNTVGGDDCDANCNFEANLTFTAPGGPQTFTTPITPIGDFDVVQITVAQDSYLRAETFTDSTVPECVGADSRLTLFTASGTVALGGDDFDGLNSCSLITPNDGFARLAVGTYWLAVNEDGNNAEIAALDLVLEGIQADICGNGIVDGQNEVCDDGNLIDNDGCSSACQPDGVLVTETEPNDDTATANLSTLVAPGVVTIDAAIPVGGDEDFFSFDIPGTIPMDVRLQTYGTLGDVNSCPNIDTAMHLLDAGGNQLAFNDDGGAGFCSLITTTLAPGQYFVRIRGFNANTVVPQYFLDIDAMFPPPVAETEPNDDIAAAAVVGPILPGYGQVTVQAAISPATDHDFFEIVVPAGGGDLTASTHSDRLDSANACGFDTRMWLRDAAGAQVDFNDDGGPGLCSLLNGVSLAAGTYYIEIDEFNNNSEIPNYFLELSLTPPPPVAETEPNDDVAGAIAVGTVLNGPGSVIMQAAITPAGDHDYFEIVVTVAGTLTAATYTDQFDPSSCNADTQLWLRDAADTQIDFNDDGGPGLCSLLNGIAVTPGTYYLDVGDFNDNDVIAEYYLSITLQ